MRVAHSPGELERKPRAVAIGTFDGVHRGHRAVLDATLAAGGAAGRVPTAVTFHPHPRVVLGYQVDLLCTIERRLELLAAAGIEETLVVEFTPEIATLEPAAFVREYLEALGAEVVVAGEGFRFGRLSGGDLATIRSLGLDARAVPIIDGVSSTRIRTLAHAGAVDVAAGLLGRPFELDGIVVTGDQRGGTLGFPTANLRVAPELLVPEFGIYAGAVGDRRAAVSIGVNPHYGGSERRIEAFLLDWEGDLYGSRLVLELWKRLRDERVFDSEADLIGQIAQDVAETRAVERPG
jgi:riboflavin kinase / FMN adenylyltransferase